MKVQNWTNKTKPPQIFHQINPLAPQHPYRLLAVGPSGSGKTVTIVDLVMSHTYFDVIYIFARDLTEPLYEMLIEFFERCQAEDPDNAPEFYYGSEVDDVPSVDDLDKDKQNLILFDDFILEKDQSSIAEFYVRARKKNCSSIYMSQSYTKTPRIIRENCNYFCLFRVPERRQQIAICSQHCGGMEYSRFKQLYNEIMKKKHAFMLIDKATDNPHLAFRDGWDGLLTDPYDDDSG